MDLQFTIDRELCTQCGACVDDCPFHIIELTPDYPALNPARAHHCIRCQHCLAVCPTGALSILGLSPADSLPLPESLPAPDLSFTTLAALADWLDAHHPHRETA